MHSNIASPAAQWDCVLVVGHGRSGTNWLLDILDASSSTHVRNEPNEIAGAPLAALPSPWVTPRLPEFGQRWDEAAAWAARHMGNRDHHAHVPKVYYHRWASALHLPRALVRPKIRAKLSVVSPSLRAGEWRLPWWAGSQRRMAAALPVLKFTQVPGWACWLLEHRPRIALVHIVRHPGGFLNSWRNRYVSRHDPNQVSRENIERLTLIADTHPAWAARFGRLDAMSLEASELWFWRYAAETIHGAGEHRPNYMLVNYERLATAPVEWAAKIYALCGLSWDAVVQRRIHGAAGESKDIAAAWRERLEQRDVDLIEGILHDSVMRAWWE